MPAAAQLPGVTTKEPKGWRRYFAACALDVAPLLLYVAALQVVGATYGIALLPLLMAALVARRIRLVSRKAKRQSYEIPPQAASKFEGGANDALLRELAALKETQHELVAAKQAAEAAMMAKGEFLATMSHEIRTPLNGILPTLEILLPTAKDAEQKEYLTTAHISAREMLRIVNDILSYSKLESGTLQLEAAPTNLREAMESVIKLMESSAKKKSLHLTLQVEP